VCHGYTSNRGMLLTLASSLQDHQYNVFLFDFAGHGSSSGYTTLGFRESQELRAALDTLSQRTDVDPTRYGVWGTNLGAYAAIAAAETDRRIRAIVVDSIYDDPSQMVNMQINRTGLGGLPMVGRWAHFGFRWLNYPYRRTPPISGQMASLEGVPKLFIQVLDEPRLAEMTQEMFEHAPEPREQAILPHGDYGNMLDEDKHAYETRIINFFLLRLPPSQPLVPAPARKQ
jgi:pimeloyl-ACP methyl ester carboxylesterase